jgi:hypothetical protein
MWKLKKKKKSQPESTIVVARDWEGVQRRGKGRRRGVDMINACYMPVWKCHNGPTDMYN